MGDAQLQQLVFGLAQPEGRRETGARIAAALGAEALFVFALDEEVRAFLPARGLPQTRPGGAGWRELLQACESAGVHRAEVALPDGRQVPAIAVSDGTAAFVLAGGAPRVPSPDELALPLLGALLRAEFGAMAAQGREKAARAELRHAAAVNAVLDATRGELERTVHQTRALVAELELASTQKDEFLAMLAHELRNPLAPIVTAVALLRKGRQHGALPDRALTIIERQTRHLVRLVDDLLDVSRISHGRIELRREPVDLGAVLRMAVEDGRPVVEQERHTLTLTLPKAPLPATGDPVRLAQVFGNLLTNAAKYTPPGGRIDVEALALGSACEIRVRDTGIGIEPEMLPRVFDLFIQAPRSLDRAKGGLGIGLTLVRRMVEMHGGSVHAESGGAGKGSVFVVRLPLAEESLSRAPSMVGP